MRVGFIGLGLMGNLMTKCILKAGFELTVYNRTASKTEELENLGAKIASSPKELAKQSDVVITMVTAANDVKEVLFGKEGAIKGNKKMTIIDMSTIGPSAAKDIANKLEKYKIDFIDAPVTGSTNKAATGELTIFIGGKQEAFERVKPVFLSMGKTLHYMGDSGMGQAIKMINNQAIASSIETVAEGMLLADTMGLPREKVAEVMKTVPAYSGVMNLKAPNFVNETYPLMFSTKNMKKDISLAVKEMKKGKKKLPILAKLEKIYAETEKKYKEDDFSNVIKVIENKD